MMAYIDRVFKGYGVERFGQDAMDKLTDTQIETARCAAFSVLNDLTAKYGKQEKGTVENLFCENVSHMLAAM